MWAGAGNAFPTVTNFRVQTYKGESVLTFWTGDIFVSLGGLGQGYAFILDRSYDTIATVKAGRHGFADLHEFSITADDTALVIIYNFETADLSQFGVSGSAWIANPKFQEIDIETGEVTRRRKWLKWPRFYSSGRHILMSISAIRMLSHCKYPPIPQPQRGTFST